MNRTQAMRRLATTCCALICCFGSARGQAGKTEKPKDESVVAVVGATVLPVSRAMIRRGTVIWKGGKIEAVGSELEVPQGAKVYNADGKYVCPGFIAIGAAGLGMETPRGDLRHSLDPYDLELRVALAKGITTAHVIQQSYFGGFSRDRTASTGTNSAVIKLTHGDLKSMFLREPAFNYLSLPSRQIELNLYNLRDRFKRAAKYLADLKEAEAKKKSKPRMERDLALYVSILKNERATIVSADELTDVRVALELQKEYGFDLVLREPSEALAVAPELASRRIPVLLKTRGADFSFSLQQPILDELGMVPNRRPAAFAAAGVEVTVLPYRRGVSLSGLAGRDLSTLAMDAAFAVRGGLSDDDGLKTITLHPARLLKLQDRIGSLEKGKDADLLILTGHPLHYRTQVLKAFINGEVYYEREKSRLFRKIPLPGE